MIKINDEVYYSGTHVTLCNTGVIEDLKEKASANKRKRVRLCSHPDTADRIHEMIIVHERDCYVKPHKHPGKSESTHIIEGRVDIIFYDDQGRPTNVIQMGDAASGLQFYLRIDEPVYHTLLIKSDVLVFHETTNGPFDRNDTVFAGWAPDDSDEHATKQFVDDLHKLVKSQNFI